MKVATPCDFWRHTFDPNEIHITLSVHPFSNIILTPSSCLIRKHSAQQTDTSTQFRQQIYVSALLIVTLLLLPMVFQALLAACPEQKVKPLPRPVEPL